MDFPAGVGLASKLCMMQGSCLHSEQLEQQQACFDKFTSVNEHMWEHWSVCMWPCIHVSDYCLTENRQCSVSCSDTDNESCV